MTVVDQSMHVSGDRSYRAFSSRRYAAIVCGALATACLGWFYALSPSYGSTYGPLTGIIALLGWCFASSLSLLFGAAVCAQLESVRHDRGIALAVPGSDNHLNGLAHSGAIGAIDRWRHDVMSG